MFSELVGETLWTVADEEDAKRVNEPRGQVYTLSEIRHVIEVTKPEHAKEIHQWKKKFNGTITHLRAPWIAIP